MQKFLSLLNPLTKITLAIGLLLMAYSFLCRGAGIYFFWESDYVGTLVLMIAVISFLSGLIKRRKGQNKKTTIAKVAIGFIVFSMVLLVLAAIVFNNSDAYAAAKKQLSQNPQLKKQVGNITGFGFFPTGTINFSSSGGKTAGTAELSLTVKGDQRFKDLYVVMVKNPEKEEWEIAGVE